MANDNQPGYARIGFILVAAVVATLGALVYFGGMRGRDSLIYAETYSNEDVTGLSVGSEVLFRGVKVGEVKEISFIGAKYEVDDDDAELNSKIYIRLAIDTKKLGLADSEDPVDVLNWYIEKGMHSTVTSSGITGLSKIMLHRPKTPVNDEKIGWRPELPLIPPAPSMFANLSYSANRIMDQLNRMNFVEVFSNITELTRSAGNLADSVNRLVESERPSVATILSNIEEASSSIKAFARRVEDDPSLLLRSNDPERVPETSR